MKEIPFIGQDFELIEFHNNGNVYSIKNSDDIIDEEYENELIEINNEIEEYDLEDNLINIYLEIEEECNNIGLPYLQNCSCVNFIQFIKNL
jgi:hypothetical protein|tara:strand:+ start:535 stop:807 length:273 start_codon:yes stop_codon:yes gene_type:complete